MLASRDGQETSDLGRSSTFGHSLSLKDQLATPTAKPGIKEEPKQIEMEPELDHMVNRGDSPMQIDDSALEVHDQDDGPHEEDILRLPMFLACARKVQRVWRWQCQRKATRGASQDLESPKHQEVSKVAEVADKDQPRASAETTAEARGNGVVLLTAGAQQGEPILQSP